MRNSERRGIYDSDWRKMHDAENHRKCYNKYSVCMRIEGIWNEKFGKKGYL